MTDFKIAYGKNHRPQFDDLDLFWMKDISYLFHRFSDYIMKNYDLRFAVPTWTEKNGWSYRIGRSGIFLFSNITIFQTGFQIDDIKVVDQRSYDKLLIHIDKVYLDQKDDFELKVKTKNKKQKERTKQRLERE